MRPLWLMLLLAGCASVPPPSPEDFVETCTARHASMPAYRIHAVTRERVPQESLESYLPFCTRVETGLAAIRSRSEQRERNAMVAAILFGAASDALATHNFYVYRVPEARRYLDRNR